MPTITVLVTATLPKVATASVVSHVFNTGDVAVTLPSLQAAIDIFNSEPFEFATIAVTLPSLEAAINVSVPSRLTGAIILSKLRARGAVNVRGRIQPFAGEARAFGDVVLCFTGPPYHAVTWAMITGTGVLTPLSASTDRSGHAFCRYSPNGFVGEAVVGASYAA